MTSYSPYLQLKSKLQNNRMQVASSPCPNDLFLFYDWDQSSAIQLQLADLNTLNGWAMTQQIPLIKLSLPALAVCLDRYALLPIGTAFSQGEGPKFVLRQGASLDQLSSIAVPGLHTTAYALLRQYLPSTATVRVYRYNTICDALERGEVDGGLLIHESQWNYKAYGFVEGMDLGKEWNRRTGLPLPLGGLALRRDFKWPELVLHCLQRSMSYARDHWQELVPFLQQHSQEEAEALLKRHIDTFISEDTYSLSTTGKTALRTLLQLPNNSWLHPICDSF